MLSSRIRKAGISVETGRYRLAAAAAVAQEQQRSKEEVVEFQRLASEGAVVDITPPDTPPAGGNVTVLLAGVDVDKYKPRIKVYVDGKPTVFDQATSTGNKISQVKIPPAAPGQPFATVRVQVGPVALQGERQQLYK